MKNRMKKLVLAVATFGMVLGFGGLAFAHGGHGHGPRGAKMAKMFQKLEGMSEQEQLEFLEERLDRRVAKVTEKLNLDEKQQGQARQIFADVQTQLLEIYEQNKDAEDKSAAAADARAVMKQARGEFKAILTEAQLETMREHRQKRKAKRHHKRKGARGH